MGTGSDITVRIVTAAEGVPDNAPTGWLGDEEAVFGYVRGVESKVGSLIHLNNYNFGNDDWNEEYSGCPLETNQETDDIDIQTILTHEIGHSLGLDDAPAPHTKVCTRMRNLEEKGKCYRGVTPTQLDWAAIKCRYPDLNTDAMISGFGIVDGVARWTVLTEEGTAYYLIETAADPNTRGTPIHFEPNGVGPHAYSAEFDPLSWYRLVEVDRQGKYKHLASARPKTRAPVAQRESTTVGATVRTSSAKRSLITTRVANSSPPPTCAIYTTIPHASVAGDIADSWETSFGQTVWGLIFTPGDPANEAREVVHNDMKGLYETYGTRRFHIIADDATIAGSFGAGEFPQSAFLASSDQELADLDYDGVPDVIVTRWSAGYPIAQLSKMMMYSFERDTHASRSASFLVGNQDAGQYEGSGALTDLMANDLKSLVAVQSPSETIRTMKWSSYPDWGDRNVAVSNHIDTHKPELLVVLATRSGSSMPGRWFNKYPGVSPSWTMSLLDYTTPSLVVIAASCGSAGFDDVGTEIGTPVCNDFLSAIAETGGAVAWIGAYGDRTDQTPNHLFSRFLLEEFFQQPYRAMAESWLEALQRAYAELGAVDEYRLSLNQLVFLGDPVTPFRALPTIVSYVKRAGSGNIDSMWGAPAVTCPGGDGDHVVVEVNIDARDITGTLTAQDVTLSQPADPSIALYSDSPEIIADGAPVYVTNDPNYPQGCYKATFTIENVGGCGESSAVVRLRGDVVGPAQIRLRSPDVHVSPQSSRARVTLNDFATFGMAYPSSRCNCVYSNAYNDCVDFVAPDTTVNLGDFNYLATHYNHEDPNGGGYGPVSQLAASAGRLDLQFVEERPVIGEHLLRVTVSLEGVEPFSVFVASLKNDNALLEFKSWTGAPDFPGQTICTPVARTDGKQVFIGVFGTKQAPPPRFELGELVFVVRSDEELELADEDLAVAISDVLTIGGSALRMTSPAGRSVRPVVLEMSLAQNYPNPFNPATTIAFSIKQSENVELAIFDVRGRLIRTLVNESRQADNYRESWDGLDEAGTRVASGVYFYRLRAGSYVATKKMMLMK